MADVTADSQWLERVQAGDIDGAHARYLELVRGGVTPVAALPYPDPTDPVAEGADAIRALAEAVDDYLPTAWAGFATPNASWAISSANPQQFRRVQDMVELRGVLMYNQVASTSGEVIGGVGLPPQAADNEGFQLAAMYGDSAVSQGGIALVWVPGDGGLRVRFFGTTTVGARVTLDGIKYRAKP